MQRLLENTRIPQSYFQPQLSQLPRIVRHVLRPCRWASPVSPPAHELRQWLSLEIDAAAPSSLTRLPAV